MAFLTSSPNRTSSTSANSQDRVSYPEFRDFLLLMPRNATTAEIYRYYEVKKFDHDARGAARINMEGVLYIETHGMPEATKLVGSEYRRRR